MELLLFIIGAMLNTIMYCFPGPSVFNSAVIDTFHVATKIVTDYVDMA
jgi:hypothetical protein